MFCFAAADTDEERNKELESTVDEQDGNASVIAEGEVESGEFGEGDKVDEAGETGETGEAGEGGKGGKESPETG